MELHALLKDDHQRLDELLEEMVRSDGTIDEEIYDHPDFVTPRARCPAAAAPAVTAPPSASSDE